MIEIRLTNGDMAEAETPENAVYAAKVMIAEAVEAWAGALKEPKASFYVDGKLVRMDVSLVELRSITFNEVTE